MQPAFHHIVGGREGGGGDVANLLMGRVPPTYVNSPGTIPNDVGGSTILRWAFSDYVFPDFTATPYPQPPLDEYMNFDDVIAVSNTALGILNNTAPADGQLFGIEVVNTFASSPDNVNIAFHAEFKNVVVYEDNNNDLHATPQNAFNNPKVLSGFEYVEAWIGYMVIVDGGNILQPVGSNQTDIQTTINDPEGGPSYQIRVDFPRYQVIKDYPL